MTLNQTAYGHAQRLVKEGLVLVHPQRQEASR
jgi:hypothetical protein